MPTNVKFKNCCDSFLFQEPWWLDALAPGAWEAAVVKKGDRVIARMPYMTMKKYGLTYLTYPPLTPFLGPGIEHSKGKYYRQLSHQMNMMDELIESLPPFDYFSQRFHYSITNWLPFYWKGFQQTTGYTYVFDSLEDLDLIWDNLKSDVRTQVRNAEKCLKIKRSDDVEMLLDLVEQDYANQGLKLPYTRSRFTKLYKACQQHSACQISFVEDSDGRVHAANFIVWDDASIYGIVSATDTKIANRGAQSLLIWEILKFASQENKIFNFGGSSIKRIERFIRNFGARQVPYFIITGMSPRMKLLMGGRDLFKASASMLAHPSNFSIRK